MGISYRLPVRLSVIVRVSRRTAFSFSSAGAETGFVGLTFSGLLTNDNIQVYTQLYVAKPFFVCVDSRKSYACALPFVSVWKTRGGVFTQKESRRSGLCWRKRSE